MSEVSKKLLKESGLRRSTRKFLPDGVDMDTIKDCIMTAGTAPSGANMQPWHYTVVTNPEMKANIRREAEAVEKRFYEEKISAQWKSDLEKLNLDIKKPFLTEAPCLIVVFDEIYRVEKDGTRLPNYYVPESCGIAAGMLFNALRNAGYATLPYTPAPADFLRDLLKRPKNEKPVMIICVGKPDPAYEYPEIFRKSIDEIMDIV